MNNSILKLISFFLIGLYIWPLQDLRALAPSTQLDDVRLQASAQNVYGLNDSGYFDSENDLNEHYLLILPENESEEDSGYRGTSSSDGSDIEDDSNKKAQSITRQQNSLGNNNEVENMLKDQLEKLFEKSTSEIIDNALHEEPTYAEEVVHKALVKKLLDDDLDMNKNIKSFAQWMDDVLDELIYETNLLFPGMDSSVKNDWEEVLVHLNYDIGFQLLDSVSLKNSHLSLGSLRSEFMREYINLGEQVFVSNKNVVEQLQVAMKEPLAKYRVEYRKRVTYLVSVALEILKGLPEEKDILSKAMSVTTSMENLKSGHNQNPQRNLTEKEIDTILDEAIEFVSNLQVDLEESLVRDLGLLPEEKRTLWREVTAAVGKELEEKDGKLGMILNKFEDNIFQLKVNVEKDEATRWDFINNYMDLRQKYREDTLTRTREIFNELKDDFISRLSGHEADIEEESDIELEVIDTDKKKRQDVRRSLILPPINSSDQINKVKEAQNQKVQDLISKETLDENDKEALLKSVNTAIEEDEKSPRLSRLGGILGAFEQSVLTLQGKSDQINNFLEGDDLIIDDAFEKDVTQKINRHNQNIFAMNQTYHDDTLDRTERLFNVRLKASKEDRDFKKEEEASKVMVSERKKVAEEKRAEDEKTLAEALARKDALDKANKERQDSLRSLILTPINSSDQIKKVKADQSQKVRNLLANTKETLDEDQKQEVLKSINTAIEEDEKRSRLSRLGGILGAFEQSVLTLQKKSDQINNLLKDNNLIIDDAFEKGVTQKINRHNQNIAAMNQTYYHDTLDRTERLFNVRLKASKEDLEFKKEEEASKARVAKRKKEEEEKLVEDENNLSKDLAMIEAWDNENKERQETLRSLIEFINSSDQIHKVKEAQNQKVQDLISKETLDENEKEALLKSVNTAIEEDEKSPLLSRLGGILGDFNKKRSSLQNKSEILNDSLQDENGIEKNLESFARGRIELYNQNIGAMNQTYYHDTLVRTEHLFEDALKLFIADRANGQLKSNIDALKVEIAALEKDLANKPRVKKKEEVVSVPVPERKQVLYYFYHQIRRYNDSNPYTYRRYLKESGIPLKSKENISKKEQEALDTVIADNFNGLINDAMITLNKMITNKLFKDQSLVAREGSIRSASHLMTLIMDMIEIQKAETTPFTDAFPFGKKSSVSYGKNSYEKTLLDLEAKVKSWMRDNHIRKNGIQQIFKNPRARNLKEKFVLDTEFSDLKEILSRAKQAPSEQLKFTRASASDPNLPGMRDKDKQQRTQDRAKFYEQVAKLTAVKESKAKAKAVNAFLATEQLRLTYQPGSTEDFNWTSFKAARGSNIQVRLESMKFSSDEITALMNTVNVRKKAATEQGVYLIMNEGEKDNSLIRYAANFAKLDRSLQENLIVNELAQLLLRQKNIFKDAEGLEIELASVVLLAQTMPIEAFNGWINSLTTSLDFSGFVPGEEVQSIEKVLGALKLYNEKNLLSKINVLEVTETSLFDRIKGLDSSDTSLVGPAQALSIENIRVLKKSA